MRRFQVTGINYTFFVIGRTVVYPGDMLLCSYDEVFDQDVYFTTSGVKLGQLSESQAAKMGLLEIVDVAV